jgi:serine O-acetyltransferase
MSQMSWREYQPLFGDLWRYVPRGFESRGIERVCRFIAAALLHPGWQAVFLLRLAQLCWRCYLHPLGWLLYRVNLHLFAIDIHPAVSIGPGLWLPHPVGIVIARDTIIGERATIFQNVTIGGRGTPIQTGGDVMLGAGCVVLGGVALGDKVRVGANAVVTKSFPAGVTLVGVPAMIVKARVADATERSSIGPGAMGQTIDPLATGEPD